MHDMNKIEHDDFTDVLRAHANNNEHRMRKYSPTKDKKS